MYIVYHVSDTLVLSEIGIAGLTHVNDDLGNDHDEIVKCQLTFLAAVATHKSYEDAPAKAVAWQQQQRTAAAFSNESNQNVTHRINTAADNEAKIIGIHDMSTNVKTGYMYCCALASCRTHRYC